LRKKADLNVIINSYSSILRQPFPGGKIFSEFLKENYLSSVILRPHPGELTSQANAKNTTILTETFRTCPQAFVRIRFISD
jgi:hypothetical protein